MPISSRVAAAGVTLALALTLALLAPVVPAGGQSSPSSVAGLEHLGTEQASTRGQIAYFRSPALTAVAAVRILLPDGYDPSGATRYPVLYLLHGGAGSSTRWLVDGNAEAITAGYPLIVVMPDGGPFGFYADWWNFGVGGPPKWETFHLSQLLPWIDEQYPTVAGRDGRAVAGESMGGLGAIHYAAKRPDLFTAALSFSGAVDTNLFVAPPIVEVLAATEGLNLPAAVFGPRVTDEIRWRGHNPVDLAGNLRGVYLKLDTGTGVSGGPLGVGGDPVEGAMYQMGSALHERLTQRGIDHIWNSGPGCHCWPQWHDDLREGLPLLMERFAHPAPVPSPFDYTSIDPSYAMYGWQVDITRPALEQSELSNAGPGGFSLRGSGDARVRTAPLFEPGRLVGTTVADAAGTTRAELVADEDGRLAVPVSLGPGNPFQQLSPVGTVWAAATGAPVGTWPSVTASVRFDSAPVAPTTTAGAAAAGSAATTVPPRRSLPITGHEAAPALLAALGALVISALLRRATAR